MTADSDPIKLLQLVNPVPAGSLREVAAERTEDLLVRLHASQVAAPTLAAPRRRWRPLPVAIAVAGALALTGVGIADGFGAFSGISATEHPQGAADMLDPAVVAAINRQNASPQLGDTGQLLPESTRFIRKLPGGERVYALSTTTNKLCDLIVYPPSSNAESADSCGDPLSQNAPTTVEVDQPNPAVSPLAIGVAIDGVTSVSFRAGGVETTVPVEHNVWVYQGASNALQALTVHFADGRTQTLIDGRTQAASSGR